MQTADIEGDIQQSASLPDGAPGRPCGPFSSISSFSVASLSRTADHRATSLHGERLRQAIERKQRVIVSLLRVLGLNKIQDEADYEDTEGVARHRAGGISGAPRGRGRKVRKKDPKILQNEANKSFGIKRAVPKTLKNEAKKSPQNAA